MKMYTQDPVQSVIWHCLQNYDYKNAIFLSECLCADLETDETVYLLATSYYRAQQIKQAYWLLKKKSCRSSQCRYLQARCAFELKDYAAAEHIFTHDFGAHKLKSFDIITKDFGNIACFVFQLMGQIYYKTERIALACQAYRQALKLNPFLWQSYVELCHMGENVAISEVYQINDALLKELSQCPWRCQVDEVMPLEDATKASFYTPKNNINNACNESNNISSTPFIDESIKFQGVTDESGFALLTEQFNSMTSISPMTPSCTLEKSNYDKPITVSEEVAPSKWQTLKTTETSLQSNINIGTKLHVFTPAGNIPTRSATERQNLKSSLPNSETDSAKENKHTTTLNKWSPRKPKYRFTKEVRLDESDEDKSFNAKAQTSPPNENPTTTHFEDSKTQHFQEATQHLLALRTKSANKMLTLLHDFAVGYKLLAQYQCKKAIEHFELKLPKNQLVSCSLQSLIGKCHYELQHYEQAALIFQGIHEAEPCRFAYMDLYSSCLWQLQQPVELSALAQDLVNCNRLSPITWCVAGNCFSLQNDHTTAIKLMQRAVQLDADFAYGYTLLGYEHVYHEDLDEARNCFATAVARDYRHYNAWFGIGATYAKQQKHQIAEFYFRKALKINPTNSVILVHIAVMQQAQQHLQQALLTLNTASRLNPDNLIAKLQRARICFALKCYQQALQQLEELKNLAPQESIVFQLLGNVHQAMGHNEMALLYFSWSMDMDSKKAEPFTPVLPKRWV